ncbi:MAG: hypothetical protein QXG00_01480 [Candidatus Woesearchaeota archaeon]
MKALITIDMFVRYIEIRKEKYRLINNQLKLIQAFKKSKQNSRNLFWGHLSHGLCVFLSNRHSNERHSSKYNFRRFKLSAIDRTHN